MQKPALDWIRLRWERESRYYEAHLQQDLWGDWIVTKVWGQRSSRLGRVMNIPCNTYQKGLAMLVQIDRTRKQKGYRLVLKKGNIDL